MSNNGNSNMLYLLAATIEESLDASLADARSRQRQYQTLNAKLDDLHNLIIQHSDRLNAELAARIPIVSRVSHLEPKEITLDIKGISVKSALKAIWDVGKFFLPVVSYELMKWGLHVPR